MKAAAFAEWLEKEDLTPLLGRALKARKELRRIVSEGTVVDFDGYRKVRANINAVIAHERSNRPGRTNLLYPDEAGAW